MSGEISVLNTLPPGASGQPAPAGWSTWGDWAGMVASIGCAIHCAAMPFVIAYLPALGLRFLADEAFHQWMAAACFAIALTAFVPGLRKHRRMTPVVIGSIGLVMISIAAFGFAGDCCASCESVPAAGTTEVCTEACCLPGAMDDATAKLEDMSTAGFSGHGSPVFSLTSLSSAFGRLGGHFASWLTPLGGIVLVSAHLLNRRYGCLCGCCESVVATGN